MWQGLKDVAVCLLNVNLKFGTMIYQGEALNTFAHSSNNVKGFYRITMGFYSVTDQSTMCFKFRM